MFMFNTNPLKFWINVFIHHPPDEAERIRLEREDEHSRWLEELRRREEEEEEQIINTDKSFKSDECVICLTNPPNLFFFSCNCGHLCLCVECDKTKGLDVCPVCKTENYIKQMVE